ncbi:DUF2939 domain-containing protein [Phenylobacterium sp.]|uniref:DUF2939 domain-containing protein n=1 Tax=Phenylobacterium sp. TaxID=1871053 RepID=UPI002811F254|nr:DUF2939 domain-containing protein [Phenylobacterium sp.]
MRRSGIVLLSLIAAAALIVFSGPWFALRALQSAARDRDVQALAEIIDYPAVRAGLVSGVDPETLGPAPNIWQDPVGAVRRAIIPNRRPPAVVERRLSPDGLHAIAGEPSLFPRVRHWGPNRVRFAVRTDAGESLFTFQRQGVFRWRLVHLGLPPVTATFRDGAR